MHCTHLIQNYLKCFKTHSESLAHFFSTDCILSNLEIHMQNVWVSFTIKGTITDILQLCYSITTGEERRSSNVTNLEFLTYITDFWRSEGIISLFPSLTFMYWSCQQKNQSLFQHFPILQVRFSNHNESKNHPTAHEYHKKLSPNERSLGWAK